jgi:hypothetical protein
MFLCMPYALAKTKTTLVVGVTSANHLKGRKNHILRLKKTCRNTKLRRVKSTLRFFATCRSSHATCHTSHATCRTSHATCRTSQRHVAKFCDFSRHVAKFCDFLRYDHNVTIMIVKTQTRSHPRTREKSQCTNRPTTNKLTKPRSTVVKGHHHHCHRPPPGKTKTKGDRRCQKITMGPLRRRGGSAGRLGCSIGDIQIATATDEPSNTLLVTP